MALLSRLAQVEQKVDDLHAPAGAPPAPAEAPADPAQSPDEKARLQEREQERTAHYQKELDYLEKALADHASEPSDDGWARPLAASMEQSINKVLEGSGKTKLVDCRSKTCTATLAFPTPGEALVGLRQRADHLGVPGCKGFVAIPTPPQSAGPYDLTVVYNCR